MEPFLLPLMVALPPEGEPAACVYHEDGFFGSLTVSSLRFGVRRVVGSAGRAFTSRLRCESSFR